MNEGNFYAGRVYQRSSKDTGQLEDNANKYPFSALANFLLLYHYKKTNHNSFESFAKKSVLHFANPYWLQFLLHEEIEKENDNFTNSLPLSHQQSSGLIHQTSIEAKPAQNISEEKSTDELHKNYDDFVTGKKEDIVENNKQNESNNFLKENIVDNGNKKDGPEEVNQQHEILDIVLPKKENTEISEDAIAFEPLHTVDYFASQGIHLNEKELATNDKLGSQMKSFTAWLKSMKKLHPVKLAEQSMATEKFVQASAEESNHNTDVLTEAMAEVLIKQGKKEKAIDMYSKLSLINPSKSAYFAAKIESIKQL